MTDDRSGASGSDPSAESGGDRSATGIVVAGVADFFGLVWLWIAFGTLFRPLSVVVNAALVAEPFSFGQLAVQAPTLAAVAVTNARYPDASALRIWLVGLASTFLFVACAALAGTLDPPTSGSVVVVVRLVLLWAGSLALVVAAARYRWAERGA